MNRQTLNKFIVCYDSAWEVRLWKLYEKNNILNLCSPFSIITRKCEKATTKKTKTKTNQKKPQPRTKDHRFDRKTKSKASHLVLSFSIKRNSCWLLIWVLFNTFMLLTQSILFSCYWKITVFGKNNIYKTKCLWS